MAPAASHLQSPPEIGFLFVYMLWGWIVFHSCQAEILGFADCAAWFWAIQRQGPAGPTKRGPFPFPFQNSTFHTRATSTIHPPWAVLALELNPNPVTTGRNDPSPTRAEPFVSPTLSCHPQRGAAQSDCNTRQTSARKCQKFPAVRFHLPALPSSLSSFTPSCPKTLTCLPNPCRFPAPTPHLACSGWLQRSYRAPSPWPSDLTRSMCASCSAAAANAARQEFCTSKSRLSRTHARRSICSLHFPAAVFFSLSSTPSSAILNAVTRVCCQQSRPPL